MIYGVQIIYWLFARWTVKISDLIMFSYINSIKRLTLKNTRRALVMIREYGFLYFLKKLGIKIKFLDLYTLWFRQNEGKRISYQKYTEFSYSPLISIITATFNTDPSMLQDAIESVLGQTYSNWELCIADGNSNETVKKILQGYVGKDSRIKVVFLDKNKGIARRCRFPQEILQGFLTMMMNCTSQPCMRL